MSQVQSGKGFEYGIAYQLQKIAGVTPVQSGYLENSRSYFNRCSDAERDKIMKAAEKIVIFLIGHDTRIKQQHCTVRMQSDQEGGKGDVRDLIIETPGEEIGISAKNRHFGVKNPRLSDKIDFGKKWLGHNVSQEYWDAVVPLFEQMRSRKKRNQLWRDIPDKEDRFYVPILHAFNLEMQRIYAMDKDNVPKNLLHYLLGYYDFYKVAKENGKAVIQSFNINRTLKWGKKLSLPSTIAQHTQSSKTTLMYYFDKGWQMSFRIHNAESKVTPSLKFDVQIIGLPQHLSRHEMEY